MSRSKILGVLLVSLALMGCASGIGLAAKQAVTGVPQEILDGVDAIDKEYDLRANYQMKDMVASPAETIEAANNKQLLVGEMQARIDAFHTATNNIRKYLGVERGSDPIANAVENRAKLLKAGLDAMNGKK